ncbi:MAG: hypothetical protein KatS3mg102_1154 [Planctomycetota bacterium]|nr:MAG: hypothetical protein KatS3mg102_1154 [Planctomycetota bacterium]
MTVYRVEMPSPVVSGDPHNDTIYGFDHVPWLGAEAAAIVLPIAAGRDLVLERSFATWLALRGIRAFVMPLPYQHERGAGARRDVLRREGGLEDLLAFFRQAVLDTERVRQWLVQAQGGAGGAGGAGRHLARQPGGGARLRPRSGLRRGGAAARRGRSGPRVIWHGSRETRRLKERLLEAGHDLASVRAALRPVDPLSWARPERGRGLLMLNATRDEVFPRRSTERLLAAWGPEARIVWFPGDHYSVALFLPVALEQVASHLRAQLLERR